MGTVDQRIDAVKTRRLHGSQYLAQVEHVTTGSGLEVANVVDAVLVKSTERQNNSVAALRRDGALDRVGVGPDLTRAFDDVPAATGVNGVGVARGVDNVVARAPNDGVAALPPYCVVTHTQIDKAADADIHDIVATVTSI